ncbi:hypothetical protein LTR85_011355 [Meristemomyces frigidus]|nr:hypothetical protein LTR85_011355 [Meristemomyces frigidus]
MPSLAGLGGIAQARSLVLAASKQSASSFTREVGLDFESLAERYLRQSLVWDAPEFKCLEERLDSGEQPSMSDT